MVDDPYLGGPHLMDVRFVRPFFYQGELWCWLANTGGWVDTPVYRRKLLPSDSAFAGPAIVEQLACTTVIDPGAEVGVDAMGNLAIEVGT